MVGHRFLQRLIGFLKDVIGLGEAGGIGDDLLELGTSAVMQRGLRMGSLLVLPDHVAFTLPPEELRVFRSSRLQEGLVVSLRRAVGEQAHALAARLEAIHGVPVTVMGGTDLRVTLDQGTHVSAQAHFEDRPPEVTEAGVTVVDDITQPGGELRLLLHSDDVVVGSVALTTGELLVGRDTKAALKVPETKSNVSRSALRVTRTPAGTVVAQVPNRQGAWLGGPPAAGGAAKTRGSQHVDTGERVTLQPGQQIALDSAGTVRVSLEARGR